MHRYYGTLTFIDNETSFPYIYTFPHCSFHVVQGELKASSIKKTVFAQPGHLGSLST